MGVSIEVKNKRIAYYRDYLREYIPVFWSVLSRVRRKLSGNTIVNSNVSYETIIRKELLRYSFIDQVGRLQYLNNVFYDGKVKNTLAHPRYLAIHMAVRAYNNSFCLERDEKESVMFFFLTIANDKKIVQERYNDITVDYSHLPEIFENNYLSEPLLYKLINGITYWSVFVNACKFFLDTLKYRDEQIIEFLNILVESLNSSIHPEEKAVSCFSQKGQDNLAEASEAILNISDGKAFILEVLQLDSMVEIEATRKDPDITQNVTEEIGSGLLEQIDNDNKIVNDVKDNEMHSELEKKDLNDFLEALSTNNVQEEIERKKNKIQELEEMLISANEELRQHQDAVQVYLDRFKNEVEQLNSDIQKRYSEFEKSKGSIYGLIGNAQEEVRNITRHILDINIQQQEQQSSLELLKHQQDLITLQNNNS